MRLEIRQSGELVAELAFPALVDLWNGFDGIGAPSSANGVELAAYVVSGSVRTQAHPALVEGWVLARAAGGPWGRITGDSPLYVGDIAFGESVAVELSLDRPAWAAGSELRIDIVPQEGRASAPLAATLRGVLMPDWGLLAEPRLSFAAGDLTIHYEARVAGASRMRRAVLALSAQDSAAEELDVGEVYGSILIANELDGELLVKGVRGITATYPAVPEGAILLASIERSESGATAVTSSRDAAAGARFGGDVAPARVALASDVRRAAGGSWEDGTRSGWSADGFGSGAGDVLAWGEEGQDIRAVPHAMAGATTGPALLGAVWAGVLSPVAPLAIEALDDGEEGILELLVADDWAEVLRITGGAVLYPVGASLAEQPLERQLLRVRIDPEPERGWIARVNGPDGALAPTPGAAGGGGGGDVGASASPADLAGISFWMRAALLAGADDGGGLVAISDSSGAGHSLWDDVSGILNLPTYRGGWQGRGGVELTAATKWLQSHATGVLRDASSWLVVVVFEPVAVVTDSGTPYANDTLLSDDGGNWGLHLRGSDPYSLVGYSFDGAVTSIELPITLGVPHLAILRHSGGELLLSLDGVDSDPVAAGDTSGVVTGLLRLGAPALASQSIIGDAIICSPAPSDLSSVLAALSTYYGL